MTSTVPRQGPPTTGGPTGVRLDARLGEVYAYTIRDHVTDEPVPDDYVGQSRNQPRRDRQHRGLEPERDGVVRQKPWADRIVGVRIVERGVWTKAELDERERFWVEALKPRMNHDMNLTNPNRIPIPVQHRQRKERDPGWVIPDWTRPSAPVPARPAPSRDVSWTAPVRRWVWRKLRAAARVVAPWAALWLALCVSGIAKAPIPDGRVPGTAAFVTGALAVAWWLITTEMKASKRRRNRRRRT